MPIPPIIKNRLSLLGNAGNFEEFSLPVKNENEDSIICGFVSITGVKVAMIFSNTALKAGSIGAYSADKINALLEIVKTEKLPFFAHFESTGARIQEGIMAMHSIGELFRRLGELSGLVPSICMQSGVNSGATAYCGALMDLVIMIKDRSHSFITGPRVIKKMLGSEHLIEEIGSAHLHSKQTGFCAFQVEDEQEAYQVFLRLIKLLYNNNEKQLRTAAHKEFDHAELLTKMNAKQAYDILPLIETISDADSVLELYKEYAKNVITAFASIAGRAVGIIANQPKYLSGALDVSACKKMARFIQLCNAYGLPIVFIADCPGFMPGKEEEERGILLAGAKVLNALANAEVPKISLVVNKLIGGSYGAMCSKGMGADMVLAWTNAHIAIVGLESAMEIIYKKKIDDAVNKQEAIEKYSEEYNKVFKNMEQCLKEGIVNAVIEPPATRAVLLSYLDKIPVKSLLSKTHKSNLFQL